MDYFCGPVLILTTMCPTRSLGRAKPLKSHQHTAEMFLLSSRGNLNNHQSNVFYAVKRNIVCMQPPLRRVTKYDFVIIIILFVNKEWISWWTWVWFTTLLTREEKSSFLFPVELKHFHSCSTASMLPLMTEHPSSKPLMHDWSSQWAACHDYFMLASQRSCLAAERQGRESHK